MKKALSIIALLAVTLSVCAERVAPYRGSRIFWDTTSRTVVFGGGQYARIIKLQDGRLMAATEWGGRINVTYSRNLGGSWESPTVIASPRNNINQCVPDLIQLSDGTIIVAYNPRPATPYSADRLFGIRCKRSTDNGATWSDEIFVNDANSTFNDGCWEPSMLELPSGELQLYFADEGPYTYSNEQQISMCRSFDRGMTWSAPQKICFRPGFRDGMPVPILLKDQSEIVVAIEDNGWGYGDFFPTTVRCPLPSNWQGGYFVDAASAARRKTLDFSFTPTVTGGAPYLRVLPNGETVLSWQSAYESNGVLKMWVAVGDDKAENFKALSTPFITPPAEATMWNSVAVIDTVVAAVGSTANGVEMIKGYPKRQFEASHATPAVDGKYTRGEGYYTPTASQVRLGTQTGTLTMCDFAYDRDSLYFFCRVTDRTIITDGAYQDMVKLYVDAAGTSDTKPAIGTFRYQFRLNGQTMRYEGNGNRWASVPSQAPRTAVTTSSTSYIIEAAIPWTDMNISAPAADNIAVNIEIQNGSTTSILTETIPDAKASAPWTWMPLHLQDFATAIRQPFTAAHDGSMSLSVSDGHLHVDSATAVKTMALYTSDGRKIADYAVHSNKFSAPAPPRGIVIVSMTLDDGTTSTHKLCL